ncbi:dipeptide/oligopeptide/nickel ABC transporter permease/ATP-binding protein [Actinoallomurus iriomotensis]|uniref:Peptide ABC transporter ATP-binding protein n=1 Tax=Actinoallomurus iriomotensis TaxID=478107 RepID=A0A9W6RHK7_9ACTN|nr:dipeptide/oligopeptide/nickel ABC transporter permease/ATP-binding protein [Actinoallomurus iriomotensis]GLY76181.1 peptide ABC transporter ATP-binding protein [Actinoallomurus iriomotensis]
MRGVRTRLPAMLLVGLVLAAVIVLVAVAGPILWQARADALTGDIRQGPSGAHWLGTDALGRDVFWRTVVATRSTIEMAVAATAIAAALGTFLGAMIVSAGPAVRTLGDRVIDLLLSFPPIIIALTFTAILSPGRASVVGAIGLAFCPQFARLTNRLALSVQERDYVTVARLLGVGRFRVVTRHVVPNIAPPLLVLTSVGFATSVVTVSGLSFLGLSVQPPSYDWGSLLASGLRNLYDNPGEAFGPAAAILVTGLAAGLVGDGLVRHMDPRGTSRPHRAVRRSADPPTAGDASRAGGAAPVASVRDLSIRRPDGRELVHGISLTVDAGEIVGIVGESGSGKSLTALALARLLPRELEWSAAHLNVNGVDLADPAKAPPARLATELGIVFQDPSSSFNPALRIGTQLTEVLRVHAKMSRRQAHALAVSRLAETRVSSPELRMRQYPHELSGGMRQRAMIAAAMLPEPKLIIADEPTTALDVTVQADVLRLLKQINTTHGTAILLISHDIGVVSSLCDRICVMYAGRVVEELSVEDLRRRDVRHPYTRALLAASPDTASERDGARLVPLPGRAPAAEDQGPGCSFAPRCPLAVPVCTEIVPPLVAEPSGNAVACHVETAAAEVRS